MNDINFDITKHWLPVGEKQGSIEKDTLRIKVSGINFHTKPEANFWGVFTGCIKTEPNNPYDTNAIGFYKTDGQLLGFVQKELQDYVNLKSASNLNGNLNCSKELEHYSS